jgi:bifunctional non-homologous end joining protein LigD
MSQIDVRTGMPPVKLDRSEFEKRYRRRFVDPAFKPLQRELDAIIGGDGGKGLHVVAPITRRPNWSAVKGFARDLANAMASDSPFLYTTNSRKAERECKIYIDYLRNDKTASAVAPYLTRARDGAPIAAPSPGMSSAS